MKGIKGLLKISITATTFGIIVPLIILLIEHLIHAHRIITSSLVLFAIGAFIALIGLIFFVLTIKSKYRMIENGWEPVAYDNVWNPPKKLVLAGMYCRVRNPMVLGEILIQAGGAILFASDGIAVFAVLYFILHTVYFLRVAEPNLEKRFGRDYIDYKKHVARWIPKLRQWKPVIILFCKE